MSFDKLLSIVCKKLTLLKIFIVEFKNIGDNKIISEYFLKSFNLNSNNLFNISKTNLVLYFHTNLSYNRSRNFFVIL